MRADTVAEAVAAHYGVSKGQLLDAAADDLPLRMALGEAQVCEVPGSTAEAVQGSTRQYCMACKLSTAVVQHFEEQQISVCSCQ